MSSGLERDSRFFNSKTNRHHQRFLHVIFTDRKSSFEDVFENNRSNSSYQENIYAVAKTMHKIDYGSSP